MKLQIKSLALGVVLAYLIPVALFFALSFFEGDHHMVFREQIIGAGSKIKVTSLNLAWGIEHDDRDNTKDEFSLDYVSSVADADEQAIDRETLEAFELIRPISEQWGFHHASVSVFPTTERKGKYHIYNFSQNPDGGWKFERSATKVFIND